MRHIILASLLALPASAWAANETIEPEPVIAAPVQHHEARPATRLVTFGFAIGGDNLATREDDVTLDAGDGFYFSVGQLFGSHNPRLNTQIEIGLKMDSLDAGNGTASIQRFPLTAMVFYSFETTRIGVGPTLHIRPVYELDITSGSNKVVFDNALGLAVQVDYHLNQTFVGIRVENINYHAAPGTAFVDADSIGLHFGSEF